MFWPKGVKYVEHAGAVQREKRISNCYSTVFNEYFIGHDFYELFLKYFVLFKQRFDFRFNYWRYWTDSSVRISFLQQLQTILCEICQLVLFVADERMSLKSNEFAVLNLPFIIQLLSICLCMDWYIFIN